MYLGPLETQPDHPREDLLEEEVLLVLPEVLVKEGLKGNKTPAESVGVSKYKIMMISV